MFVFVSLALLSAPLDKPLELIALLPVSLITQTAIHEGSHVIAAKAYGYRVLEYHPYPSLIDKQFYWGYMTYRGKQKPPISLAPSLSDFVAFVATDVLLEVSMPKPAKRVAFVFGMVAPAIDFTFNLINRRSTADIAIWSRPIGGKKIIVPLGLVISALACWRLYERFCEL